MPSSKKMTNLVIKKTFMLEGSHFLVILVGFSQEPVWEKENLIAMFLARRNKSNVCN
jgi:hypothetical protein